MIDDCNGRNCSKQTIDIPIEDVVAHPACHIGSKTRTNDIALLRLARPVQFSDSIKPICLPIDTNKNYENFPLSIAGWERSEHCEQSGISFQKFE